MVVHPIPGIDDEAAEEPEDDPLPPFPISELVRIVEGRRRLPLPETAVVSAPATVPPTPFSAESERDGNVGISAEGVEQAGPPAPSLQAPGPVTLGMESPAVEIEMEVETGDMGEAEAKRARFSTMRVGAETLVHVDEESGELLQQFGDEIGFNSMEAVDDFSAMWHDDDESAGKEMTEEDLWQLRSALEPVLDAEKLQQIDDYADAVEIERSLGMNVVQWKAVTMACLELN